MILILETDGPTLLKQKEIFNKLIDEKRDKILELSKIFNYGNSAYHFRNKNIAEISLNSFDDEFRLFRKVKDGYVTLGKPKQKIKRI